LNVGAAISKRRLQTLLDAGATEGEPDYWYGVVEGMAGSLWGQLFIHKDEAAKCAAELEGHVVIVAARILEDEDGEHIEPSN
jgi:hypothetical protein